jgi:hypothetical protein
MPPIQVQSSAFEINGVKFRSYSAQDKSGEANIYYVNGYQVPYARFWATIAHTINKMDPNGHIKRALSNSAGCISPLSSYMERELGPSDNRTLPPGCQVDLEIDLEATTQNQGI